MVAPGAIIANRYRIIKVLGDGARSTRSMLADDPVRGETVVLKFINTADDRGLRQPLLPAAQPILALLPQLRHPHIRPVLDYGEPYLVSPYLAGSNLGDYLRATGPLPLDRALSFLRQAASAIDYAHSLGLVHGGLSPGNLLVTGDARLVIADFGLNALLSQVAPGPHIVHPEHFCYQTTHRTLPPHEQDRRALGSLFFHLLTGTSPFPDDKFSVEELIARESNPPRLAERGGPTDPPGLQAVLDRAWAQDKQAPFPNGAALVQAVEAARANRTTGAD